MTDKLQALASERTTRAKDLDILEKKYWSSKGIFEAKNEEIEKMTVELKQSNKRIEVLEDQNREYLNEIESLNEKLRQLKKDYTSLD